MTGYFFYFKLYAIILSLWTFTFRYIQSVYLFNQETHLFLNHIVQIGSKLNYIYLLLDFVSALKILWSALNLGHPFRKRFKFPGRGKFVGNQQFLFPHVK